jgi:hypothetical protein
VADLQNVPNYHEIVRLSNSELSQRARTALDEYIQAIKQGNNVAEKARLYEAYQDERLKRLNYIKMKYGRAS